MTRVASCILFTTFLITSCGGSNDSDSASLNESTSTSNFEALVNADKDLYDVSTTRILEADGEGRGLTAHDLVREFGGAEPIESPDLYPTNHPGAPHIYEGLDDAVGDHFVFVIHRDEDRDRDRLDITDRQRNEIKTYAGSESAVKGFEDETMVFRWKFRINSQMAVSTRFSHFFQLKAVGGLDSQPVITITGNERSSEDGMEIRHSAATEDTVLERISWSDVTGEWLEVYCRAHFSDNGDFRFILRRMHDDKILFDIDESELDLWRGESSEHFVRPKWGIYRSLADADNLRSNEEDVRFANFRVEKVLPK